MIPGKTFPKQKIVNAFAGATALLVFATTIGFSPQASAQLPGSAPSAMFRSSGPILAAGGETILVCAANNQLASLLPPAPAAATAVTNPAAVTPLSVTLQVVNGVTGAVLAQTQTTLPPLGSTDTPPDPCVNYVVPAATFAPSNSLFLARVFLNPQPLPPGICAVGNHVLSVSLQVFTPDINGSPTNIRALSFEPPDPCIRFGS